MVGVRAPYGIQRLHHFTDSRNLGSIAEHGLLSQRERARCDVKCVYGGDERSCSLDAEYGLDAYVHLSLTPYHPMQYVAVEEARIREAIDIIVIPEILSLPGIMLTYDIANKHGGRPLLPIAGWIASIDFSVLYRPVTSLSPRQRDRVKQLRRMEVLVPNGVPPDYLRYDLARARGR